MAEASADGDGRAAADARRAAHGRCVARCTSVTSTPAPTAPRSGRSRRSPNPYYDIQRLGLFFTSAPRHADILLVTGGVTAPMAEPLRRAYEVMPEPRAVVAVGTDACSGGVRRCGSEVAGGVDEVLPVDVYVPGSPPSSDRDPERPAAGDRCPHGEPHVSAVFDIALALLLLGCAGSVRVRPSRGRR